MRGRVAPIDPNSVKPSSEIGRLPIKVYKTTSFVVEAVGNPSGVGAIYINPNGLIQNRTIGGNATILSFDNVIIPK